MKETRLKIYGGTFSFSPATRCYSVYQNTIVRSLGKFNDKWFERTVRNRYKERFDSAWREELANLSRAMKDSIDEFSCQADMPFEPIFAVEAICKRVLGRLEQQGLEAEQAIREVVAEGISQDDFLRVRMRALGEVVGQIGIAAEQVEPIIREFLVEGGFIKEPSKKSKVVDGEGLFRMLRDGEVPEAEKAKTKLSALNAMPTNRELIEWCWADDDDKEPISNLAKSVGVSLADVRKKAFEKIVGKMDLSSESKAIDFRKRAVLAAQKLGYDADKVLDEVDEAIEAFDREARTAGNRLFETREEAALQRKVVDFEKKLSAKTEAEALDSREKLRALIKKLKVDGGWTLERINRAIERFDLEARSVDGREFSTREEAAKQRELSEFEAGIDLSSEESAIAAKDGLVKLVEKLGIDGTWKLTRVDKALKKFDESARTAFGVLYDTREKAIEERNSRDAFFMALKKAVADCRAEKFYLEEKIPPKKLLGARTYLKGEQDDGVFALLDTTFFGSAKTGLVASQWGLVWQNDGGPDSPRRALSWQELAKIGHAPRVRKDSTVIEFAKDAAYENCGADVSVSDVADVFGKFYEYSLQAGDGVFHKGNTPESAKVAPKSRVKKAKSKKLASGDAGNGLDVLKTALKGLGTDCIFTDEEIPDKKRKNAFSSMHVKEPIDSISVLIDATVWGSAKDGLVVTDKAIYFKNLMSDPVRLTIADIKNVCAAEKDIVFNTEHFSPGVFDKAIVESMARSFSAFCGLCVG